MNIYTYHGPGERWLEGQPTAEDRLNVARENNDHLYSALNTIMDTDLADGILLPVGGLDLNGTNLVIDADGDSVLYAAADDEIVLKVGNAERLRWLMGGTQVTDDQWYGLGAAAGRLVFDSTATPDTITVADATLVVGLQTVNTGLVPDANDGAYLGQAGTAFSDLFLAEGGQINWDNSDATLTQANNTLYFQGATLGIGGVPTSDLTVLGANIAVASGGIAEIRATDYGQDFGGSLLLGGEHNSSLSSYTFFGSIAARKETAVDGNAAGYLQFAANSTGNVLTEYARITSAGYLGIGIAAPASKLDLRDGDFSLTNAAVAHGMTAVVPTTTYGYLGTVSATAGGLHILGFSDAVGTGGVVIDGIIGDADPTDTTPGILLAGSKKNGTGTQAIGAAETVFQLRNYATNLITVLGSGNVGIGTVSPTSGFKLCIDDVANEAGLGVYASGASTYNYGRITLGATDLASPIWDFLHRKSSPSGNVLQITHYNGTAYNNMTFWPVGPVAIGTSTASAFAAGPSLTILQPLNQNDNVLEFQSANVAHPFTAVVGASTYFKASKAASTSGGTILWGFKDDDGDAGYAIALHGSLGEAADATKSTAGLGVVALDARVTNSGDAAQAVAANGNLVSMSNIGTTKWILDAEGDTWQTGGAFLGSAVGGAGAVGVLSIANGTQGAAAANEIQLVSVDLTAGNTQLSIMHEGTGQTAAQVAVASTHTLAMKVNGAQYYVLMTTVAP